MGRGRCVRFPSLIPLPRRSSCAGIVRTHIHSEMLTVGLMVGGQIPSRQRSCLMPTLATSHTSTQSVQSTKRGSTTWQTEPKQQPCPPRPCPLCCAVAYEHSRTRMRRSIGYEQNKRAPFRSLSVPHSWDSSLLNLLYCGGCQPSRGAVSLQRLEPCGGD